jgi:hypothetical protein
MITGQIEHSLQSFNAALERYVAASGKTLDQVLEKKGRDLGIRLYRGFNERQYGGPGRRKPGLARAALAARTAAGKGTNVRASLRKTFERERASFSSFATSLAEQRRQFGGTLDQFTALKEKQEVNRRQRAGLWRSIVGREIALRQSGIGVLGASFLWYRRRSNQARGTFFVKNRTGRPLGFVDKGPGYLRIVGLTSGLREVDARYGVVASALQEATADTEEYLIRKDREAFFRAVRQFAGLARA